jgi:predicted nucleic acid-binding protein
VTAEEAALLMDHLPAVAEIVEPQADVRISTDPKDDYIVGMAISGRVDCIVTGDKHHLLALKMAAGIPIITARECLARLEAG